MNYAFIYVSLYLPLQFVETISSKQTELDTFIAEGYKTALSEERRRYCFLVDRQCAVAKNSSAYHGKVSHVSTRCHVTTKKRTAIIVILSKEDPWIHECHRTRIHTFIVRQNFAAGIYDSQVDNPGPWLNKPKSKNL